jgi:hypothetical protein
LVIKWVLVVLVLETGSHREAKQPDGSGSGDSWFVIIAVGAVVMGAIVAWMQCHWQTTIDGAAHVYPYAVLASPTAQLLMGSKN